MKNTQKSFLGRDLVAVVCTLACMIPAVVAAQGAPAPAAVPAAAVPAAAVPAAAAPAAKDAITKAMDNDPSNDRGLVFPHAGTIGGGEWALNNYELFFLGLTYGFDDATQVSLTTLLPLFQGMPTILLLQVKRHLVRSPTTLVSVMTTNNETGVEQPLKGIANLCQQKGVFLHTDAAQAAYTPVNVQESRIDLVSLSGHKVYGPKGIGALYIRRGRPRVSPEPLLHGGGQERGYRSGTLPVPLIVGMGMAAQLLQDEASEEASRLKGLRDELLRELSSRHDGISVNGSVAHRAPHNLHLCIEGVDAEALLMATRDVACSTGSACTSAALEPSHVLRAMGLPEPALRSSIRLGLGRFTTTDDVSFATERLSSSIEHLRALSQSRGL